MAVHSTEEFDVLLFEITANFPGKLTVITKEDEKELKVYEVDENQ